MNARLKRLWRDFGMERRKDCPCFVDVAGQEHHLFSCRMGLAPCGLRRPVQPKTEYKEAFMLMTYATDDGAERERLWNSRDGITPFCIESRNGNEMCHVDYAQDRYAPNHVPEVGDRIFVDLTPQRARVWAADVVEFRTSNPEERRVIEEQYASREEAVAAIAQEMLEKYDGHPPDILVVTSGYIEELLEFRKQGAAPETTAQPFAGIAHDVQLIEAFRGVLYRDGKPVATLPEEQLVTERITLSDGTVLTKHQLAQQRAERPQCPDCAELFDRGVPLRCEKHVFPPYGIEPIELSIGGYESIELSTGGVQMLPPDDSIYSDRQGNPITREQYMAYSQDPSYIQVARTYVGEDYVSTVWLGHKRGVAGPRALFETLIFRKITEPDPDDFSTHRAEQREWFYDFEAEALEGHAFVVAALQAMRDVKDDQ